MKHKLTTLIFTFAVIAVTLYGMMRPSYDLGLFTDLSAPFVRFRILLASVLLLYVFVPHIRVKLTQAAMLMVGGLFLLAGVVAVFSPMLFGIFSHYTALGDVMIAVQGGVIAMLSALELNTRSMPRKIPIAVPSHYVHQLSVLKPKKSLSSS
ncbi:MAG TPA: hypothetical protein VM124_01070 [Candidatus Limnocylindrales bacterium]|nr:hypothetical protein [Candidatus Limnocylindrales bacterium]